MDFQTRAGARKFEVTFHGMNSIRFSQLSPSKRYVACSEGKKVIVWDLLRDKLVGACVMDFDALQFDFDAKEAHLYIYHSFQVKFHVFSICKEGLVGENVIEVPGFTGVQVHSVRTGHLVLRKPTYDIALIDLKTLHELKSFPIDFYTFSVDAEANALIFKRSGGKQIGYVDLASLETKYFKNPYPSNLLNFLGSSRRELYSCAAYTMLIFDAETGSRIRRVSFPEVRHEDYWITKWRVGFLFVSAIDNKPFTTFCYHPSTEVPMIHGTHEEKHKDVPRNTLGFTSDGHFSLTFENFLRVSKLDKQNSSAIRASKIDSPSCLKISGNRSIFPRRKHQDLATPSPYIPPPHIDPTCSGYFEDELFSSLSLSKTWPQTDQDWQCSLESHPDALQFKVIRCKIFGPEFKISIRSKLDPAFGA